MTDKMRKLEALQKEAWKIMGEIEAISQESQRLVALVGLKTKRMEEIQEEVKALGE